MADREERTPYPTPTSERCFPKYLSPGESEPAPSVEADTLEMLSLVSDCSGLYFYMADHGALNPEDVRWLLACYDALIKQSAKSQ